MESEIGIYICSNNEACPVGVEFKGKRSNEEDTVNFLIQIFLKEDERILVCGNVVGEGLRIWDATDGEVYKIFEKYEEDVVNLIQLKWDKDDRTLVSTDENGEIKFWNINTGKCFKTIRGFDEDIIAHCIEQYTYQSGKTVLISGSSDNQIRFWDLETYKCFKYLKGHSAWINTLNIVSLNNAKVLLTSSLCPELKIWNLENYKNIKSMTTNGPVTIVTPLNYKEHTVAVGEFLGRISIWDYSKGTILLSIETKTEVVNSIINFKWKSDILVTCSLRSQYIDIWSMTKGLIIRVKSFESSGRYMFELKDSFIDESMIIGIENYLSYWKVKHNLKSVD